MPKTHSQKIEDMNSRHPRFSRSSLYRGLCSLLLLMLCLGNQSASAADERWITSLHGNNIDNGSLEVQDQHYTYMLSQGNQWSDRFAVDDARVAVKLWFDDSQRDYYATPWSMDVTYDIELYQWDANNEVFQSVQYTGQILTINYDPAQGTTYKDIDLREYTGYHRAQLTVTGVSNPNLGNIPQDVFLYLGQYTERYYELDDVNAPIMNNIDQDVTMNEYGISWTFVEGAESYDVEWVFVDVPSNQAFSAGYQFDWRDASRVNVPTNHFHWSMAYPRGIFVYRVRAVGRNLTNTDDIIDGPWSLDNTNFINNTNNIGTVTAPGSSTPIPQKFEHDGHDLDANYQYMVTWSEDGKRKEMISYVDGMGRNRQTTTVLNSDNNAVSAMPIFDYLGRNTMSLFPSPMASQGMRFYDNLALNGAGNHYSWKDFDEESKVFSPEAMDPVQSNGAAHYYSPENAGSDLGPHNDYVPDAEGFPFTRTLLKNDGTGRVRAQAGAGLTHNMASGHTTQMWYGTPGTQYELDRLFGNEVGFARHYKKQMTMDANEQVSITYTDLKGRVIATALSGPVPDNLLALDTRPVDFPVINDNLGGSTYNSDGTSYDLSNTFLVSGPDQLYNFEYVLDPADFCLEDDQGVPCYCADCKYDLFIQILDQDGDQVDLKYTVEVNGYPVVTNATEINLVDIEERSAMAIEVTFDDPGSYTFQKTLSLNEASYQTYIDELEENQTCIPEPVVPPTPCDDCDDDCVNQYSYQELQGNTTIWLDANGDVTTQAIAQALINDCQALCLIEPDGMIDPCALQLGVLTADMGLNGQYFDNHPDLFLADGFTGNPNYQINDWLDQATVGSQSLLDWFLAQIGTSCNGCTSWNDVRTNWDPAWADILVTQHPEYCAWEAQCEGCVDENIGLLVTTQDLDDYYTDYVSADITYDPIGAGLDVYLNPLNLTQQTSFATPNAYQPVPLNINVNVHDPIFECDAAMVTVVQNEMLNWVDNDDPNGPSAFSLWYLIEDPDDLANSNTVVNPNSVIIGPGAQARFDQLHGDGTTPGLIGTGSTQITAWEFFRSSFLFMRQQYLYLRAVDQCGPMLASPDQNGFDGDGFQIRYPQIPLLDNESQWDTWVTNTSQAGCQDGCEQAIEAWMTQYAGCYDANDAAALEADLLAVCILPCDDEGVGSSNGYNGQTPPGSSFQTWDDVFTHYSISGVGCEIPEYPEPAFESEACKCDLMDDFLASFYLQNGIAAGTDPASLSTADQALLEEELEDLLTTNEVINDDFPTVLSSFLTWMDNCGNSVANTPIMSSFDCGSNLNPGMNPAPTCEDENTALLQQEANLLYQAQINLLESQFASGYRSACMDDLHEREVISVSYTLEEYHYTLFYYDQAGNRIKTVPPQAVYNHLHGPKQGQMQDAAGNDYAVSLVHAHRDPSLNVPFLHPEYEMITNYQYNSLQNLTQSTTPDGGEANFWYDDLNRVIASQNARQAIDLGGDHYSYTIYDDLGRSIEAGEVDGSGGNASDPSANGYLDYDTYLNTWLSNAGNRREVTRTYYDKGLNDLGIQNQFDNGQENTRIRVANSAYYDVYDPAVQNADLQYNYASHFSYDSHGNVDELVQENKDLYEIGQSFKKIEYVYDLISGNTNEVRYQPGQYDEYYHRYCYDADNRVTDAFTSRDGKVWQRDNKYFYYAHGPLARVEVGDQQVQSCDYTYNIHGWIKGVNAATASALFDPGSDGQATSINRSFAKDAHGFGLHYYNGDYTPIGAQNATPVVSPVAAIQNVALEADAPELFNGNIRSMITALYDQDQAAQPVFANAYQYDQIQRLREYKSYYDNVGADDAVDNHHFGSATFNNNYAASYHYDGSGNLTGMKRTGNSGVLNDMDDFTYHYYNGAGSTEQYGVVSNVSGMHAGARNRLAYVSDPTSANAYDDIKDQAAENWSGLQGPENNNYRYDELGQLEGDKAEGIENIDWYAFNKPKTVTRESGNTNADLEFRYGPDGERCVKIEKPRTGGNSTTEPSWIKTFYVRDASGQIMATYRQIINDNGSGEYTSELYVNEHNLYGNKRLGIDNRNRLGFPVDFQATLAGDRLNITSVNSLPDYSEDHAPSGVLDQVEHDRWLGDKRFELSNHLGNVLETINDRKLLTGVGAEYTADVVSYSDYYPFGMQMPGRNGASEGYRYGFNGMEQDPEWDGDGNSYHTHFRSYDSRLGRWRSIDPVEHPQFSPYSAFDNNPIYWSDPSGADGEDPKPTKTTSSTTIVSSYIEGDKSTIVSESFISETIEYDYAGNAKKITRVERILQWRVYNFDQGSSFYQKPELINGRTATRVKIQTIDGSYDGSLGDGSFSAENIFSAPENSPGQEWVDYISDYNSDADNGIETFNEMVWNDGKKYTQWALKAGIYLPLAAGVVSNLRVKAAEASAEKALGESGKQMFEMLGLPTGVFGGATFGLDLVFMLPIFDAPGDYSLIHSVGESDVMENANGTLYGYHREPKTPASKDKKYIGPTSFGELFDAGKWKEFWTGDEDADK